MPKDQVESNLNVNTPVTSDAAEARVEALFMQLIRNPLQQISKPIEKVLADHKSNTDQTTDEKTILNKTDYCWLGLSLGVIADQAKRDKIIKILIDTLLSGIEPALYEHNGIRQSAFVGLKVGLRFCYPQECETIFKSILERVGNNLKVSDKIFLLLAILFEKNSLAERHIVLDMVRDIFTQSHHRCMDSKTTNDVKEENRKLKFNIAHYFLSNVVNFIYDDEISNKFLQILAFAINDKNEKISHQAQAVLMKIRVIKKITDRDLFCRNQYFPLPRIPKHPAQLDNWDAIQKAIKLVTNDTPINDLAHGQNRRLALRALETVWQTQWGNDLVTPLAVYIQRAGEVFDHEIYVILARGYLFVSPTKRDEIENVLLNALKEKTDPSNRFEIMEALAIILIAMRNPNIPTTIASDEKAVKANAVVDAKDTDPDIIATNRQIWLLGRIQAIVWPNDNASVYSARYLAEILALHTQHMIEQATQEATRVLKDVLPKELVDVVSRYTKGMLRYG